MPVVVVAALVVSTGCRNTSVLSGRRCVVAAKCELPNWRSYTVGECIGVRMGELCDSGGQRPTDGMCESGKGQRDISFNVMTSTAKGHSK